MLVTSLSNYMIWKRQNISDFYDVLLNYADDSDLEVISFNTNELVLGLYLDVWNGRTYTITFPNICRVDIVTWICSLGRIQFGDINLIPTEYLAGHWAGLNGETNLRVAKICDQNDEEQFYIAYHGEETFKEVAHDDPILQGTWIREFDLNTET